MSGNTTLCLDEERRGDVALLIIHNPPINALSQMVRSSLLQGIARLSGDDSVKAIVITGSAGSFIAGADIRELDGPLLEPSLPEVLDAIVKSPKPVVAAIGGFALGGGGELALACHLRVAAANAKIGFPEVKLGIIPGAAGIPRLVRLISPAAALDLVASGRSIDAATAHTLGLIDVVTEPENLVDAAVAAASAATRNSFAADLQRPVVRCSQDELEGVAAHWSRRARGQASIVEAIDAVRFSIDHDFDEAAAHCRDVFLRLRTSSQARAMRYLFFAEREAHKIPGIDREAAHVVESVAVIGAGTMGRGIAAACIRAGYPTVLIERSQLLADQAMPAIAESVGRTAKSEGWSTGKIETVLARLSTATSIEAVKDRDLVIEAVFEEMEIKRAVIGQIAKYVSHAATVATNTSYLDTDVLSAASANRAHFVGLHFFAPAEVMRLVEVVRGNHTDDATIATALKFARSLGKLPVVCGVCDGFIVNRILATYRQEMEYLLEDGALPQEVDAAMEAFGMAMGPFATADLSGLDIGWARRKRLAPTRDSAMRYVKVADQLCEMGRIGRKAGSGWYSYADGQRKADPLVETLVVKASEERGIIRRPILAEEIVARATASMACEADAILLEGISPRASDIDLAIVNGLGFPAWRGGPLFYREGAHTENGVGDAVRPSHGSAQAKLSV